MAVLGASLHATTVPGVLPSQIWPLPRTAPKLDPETTICAPPVADVVDRPVIVGGGALTTTVNPLDGLDWINNALASAANTFTVYDPDDVHVWEALLVPEGSQPELCPSRRGPFRTCVCPVGAGQNGDNSGEAGMNREVEFPTVNH